MYVEQRYYTAAVRPSPAIDRLIGRIGLYACMAGRVTETTRGLARRGAQIALNSRASHGLDEARHQGERARATRPRRRASR